jgi:hypothetical protein
MNKKMLPYEEIWKILNNLLTKSSRTNWNKKVSGSDKEVSFDLTEQIDDYYMNTLNSLPQINDLVWDIPGADFSYRYKTACSLQYKLEGLDRTKTLYKVANDILELRFVLKTNKANLKTIVDEFVSHCPFGEQTYQIVYKTIGAEPDHGNIAVYFDLRVNNIIFPMEISFLTRTNVLLNEYLQTDVSKIDDLELVHHALDLRDWLESVSQVPEKEGNKVQSYVDYIYEKSLPLGEEDMDISGKDLFTSFKEGRMMYRSKVFIYSADTNDLIILESFFPNSCKDTYEYIKELIPTANIEVMGAKDIHTLLRAHRELRSTHISRDIYKFLKGISKSKNEVAY